MPEGMVDAAANSVQAMHSPEWTAALESFDQSLGELLGRLRDDEACMVTADHGNDPTTPSTDHSREYVPLLVAGARVRPGVDLGTRDTFADVGCTIADILGVKRPRVGTSFVREVRS